MGLEKYLSHMPALQVAKAKPTLKYSGKSAAQVRNATSTYYCSMTPAKLALKEKGHLPQKSTWRMISNEQSFQAASNVPHIGPIVRSQAWENALTSGLHSVVDGLL